MARRRFNRDAAAVCAGLRAACWLMPRGLAIQGGIADAKEAHEVFDAERAWARNCFNRG